MEEPLVESSAGRRKKYDNQCLIPSVLAAVLGVLFFGTFIGIIAMAASSNNGGSCDCPKCDASSSNPAPPPPPPVVTSSSSATPSPQPVFTEFTAEVISITCNNDFKHCDDGDSFFQGAFGPGKFFVESYDENGDVSSRKFSAKEDNSVTVCQKLTDDHSNCYLETGSDSLYFSTKDLILIDQAVPCSDLFPNFINYIPNRKLDKCDYYSMFNPTLPESKEDNLIVQVVVETGTGYPVMKNIRFFDSPYQTLTLYASFNPEKPQDESKLQPFPGVSVYDFRNGNGCSGEEPSYEMSFGDEAEFEVYRNQLESKRKIEQYLQLPLNPVSRVSSSHIRRTIRDARDIPEEFDARVEWSNCSDVIGTITDQAVCGSCWAMSSSGVVADRLCISRNVTTRLSPQYMVYCGTNTSGCQGASTAATWEQLMVQGTVSEECVPFTARDGQCPDTCKDYSNITDDIKVRTTGVVMPWGNSSEERVRAIQTEIMTNGTVQASMFVFSNFYSYKSGVYTRVPWEYNTGGHAVRLIGWGTENFTLPNSTVIYIDYWLGVNSWGKVWGDNGFFKIRRGTNECNIEEEVAAGLV